MPMRSLQSGAGPGCGDAAATHAPASRGRAARGSELGAAAVAAEFIARRHCEALIPPSP